MLFEQRIHMCLYRQRFGLHDLYAQHKAAECIGHRERITAHRIACRKPALEVDAPRIVCDLYRRERLVRCQTALAGPARYNQAFTMQDIRYRRMARQCQGRIKPAKPGQKLLGSPMRLCTAQRQYLLHHIVRRRTAMPAWRTRTLQQSLSTLRKITPLQLISRLPRYLVTRAQHCHRLLAQKAVPNEFDLLIHR